MINKVESPNLYDELKEMDTHLTETAAKFSHLHESLIELMEKNAELEIENQHLRDRINQISGISGIIALAKKYCVPLISTS